MDYVGVACFVEELEGLNFSGEAVHVGLPEVIFVDDLHGLDGRSKSAKCCGSIVGIGSVVTDDLVSCGLWDESVDVGERTTSELFDDDVSVAEEARFGARAGGRCGEGGHFWCW